LIWKDLLIEFRRPFELLASVSFIIGASILVSEAAFKSLNPELIIPSLWILIVFVSIFTTTISFTREVDKKTIYGLRLLPISPIYIFVSKIVLTLTMVILQGAIVLLAVSLFSPTVNILNIRVIYAFILLSIQLSIIASFISAIVMYSEGRSFLIPMFILIFVIPILPGIISISYVNIPVEFFDYLIIILEIIVTFITTSILSEFLLSV
jgi:ABC-type transport system involved in cytochrome c biogenesis permease component